MYGVSSIGGIFMSVYYKSNGLYDYLENNPNPFLKFPEGNVWALIYADKDKDFEPKVLALVIGTDSMGNEPTNVSETKNLLSQVSHSADVPLVIITFRTDLEQIEEVGYAIGDDAVQQISLIELAGKFKDLGLPVNNRPTNHAINKASSSAYQNWQRNNLGDRIVAVDIDMFKVSEQGRIIKFYELKRSYKSLDEWQPYVDDYNNFESISKLAKICEVQFDIVYNSRTTDPWNDDVENLKVFNVDFSESQPVSDGRYMSLSEFIEY